MSGASDRLWHLLDDKGVTYCREPVARLQAIRDFDSLAAAEREAYAEKAMLDAAAKKARGPRVCQGCRDNRRLRGGGMKLKPLDFAWLSTAALAVIAAVVLGRHGVAGLLTCATAAGLGALLALAVVVHYLDAIDTDTNDFRFIDDEDRR